MPSHCASCSEEELPERLKSVPWYLQVAALPLTGILLLKRLFSASTVLDPENAVRPEFFDRYCPRCLRRQIVCHYLVAIWACTFVAFWVREHFNE